MNTLDKLKTVRALIEQPENWTKGMYSDEINGHKCYCLIGAVCNAVPPTSSRLPVHSALRKQLPPKFGALSLLISFNDHPDTKHADVLALIDCAIAAEEAKTKELLTSGVSAC